MPWFITDDIDGDSYRAPYENFSWDLPADYNLAYDLVRKHEDPRGSVALFQKYPDGDSETYTFHDLDVLSDRVANALVDLGVERGDRVAVQSPHDPAVPATLLACWKLGAVTLPLSVLFGSDATRYRLQDSEAKVVVADASISDQVREIHEDCPDLAHVIEVNGDASGEFHDFDDLVGGQPAGFNIVDTMPDTPALVLYTSGTTGSPKGVLHTHGFGPGMCTGFHMLYGLDSDGANVFWTHADWAWITGPAHMVYAWHHGRPLLGYPMKGFDAEKAFELVEEYGVNKPFFAPTALRMLMNVDDPAGRYDLPIETVLSGGEALTPEIREWADETFDDVVINEVYGQTEATPIVGTCASWYETRTGSMGKPLVGHDVEVIDTDTGEPVPDGEVGEIAVRHGDDPLLFEEYWNKPEKTEAVSMGDWHLTGDLATRDEDGYLWYETRADDVIITSGYRVGPMEVESAILHHPGIEQAGVIGIPHDTRGEAIKAFVQPTPDATVGNDLREEIQTVVRDRLAEYEYPREIEFMDELPMTTTGKIRRTELRKHEELDVE